MGRVPVRAFLLLGAALAGVAACSLSQEGVMPPADTLFFPSSAVMQPDGDWLYVANSNADLRFNDGTVLVMNVGEDRTVATDSGPVTLRGAASDRARPSDWAVCPQQDYVYPLPRSTPPTCCWDALDSNILNCDERLYVEADATVRIGSFASGMVWQPNCKSPCDVGCTADPNGSRLIIGVRGDTSVTWVDVVPPGDGPHPGLRCRQDGAGGTLAECTQKVTETTSVLFSQSGDPNAPSVGLPDEPFALALDQLHGLLYVGALVGNTSVVASGGISLFDVSETGLPSVAGFPPAPKFIAPFNSPFPPNGAGNFGVTALSMHAPLGTPPLGPQELFVSSRYVPQIATMVPFLSGNQNSTTWNCAPASDVVLLGGSDSLSSGLVGSEMRGVAIIDPPDSSDQPQRAFALQRVPPDLISYDIDRNASGALTVRTSALLETCSSPTYLYHQGTRLYVNCFDTGEIYVFDATIPTLLTSFQVGRGPAGMVFDPKLPVAYVLNFTQNDIAVVDLAPGSPTEDHVIQRIGFPTITPR
jgi:hypothetical protein